MNRRKAFAESFPINDSGVWHDMLVIKPVIVMYVQSFNTISQRNDRFTNIHGAKIDMAGIQTEREAFFPGKLIQFVNIKAGLFGVRADRRYDSASELGEHVFQAERNTVLFQHWNEVAEKFPVHFPLRFLRNIINIWKILGMNNDFFAA